MMRQFVGLEDPEDRVFGAFVMGKVCSFWLEKSWRCHCFSCCCFQWMLTLRSMLTFTKGERGQVVQRKKRRLERESEMGSTVIID